MGLLINTEQGYYASGGDHGNYRFLSLKDIIEAFKATYVGKGKICENVFEGDIKIFICLFILNILITGNKVLITQK